VLASAHGLPLAQPASLGPEASQVALRHAALDVLVVAAYGLILPQAVLDLPRHGCLNIHASLLPRWRGAAPIERAIEAGDATSGITIMQMDAGLDTGPIIEAKPIGIDPRETAGTLHDKLAALGAVMIVETLDALVREGTLRSTPQPDSGATYASKIEARDLAIDWTKDAQVLDRKIRALAPAPGATATWRERPVKLRTALPLEGAPDSAPGTIIGVARDGLDVACGAGALRIVEVQPAGGRTMPAHAFALGHRLAVGERFGNG
jgi:methionyl-tRNA formyltransferase